MKKNNIFTKEKHMKQKMTDFNKVRLVKLVPGSSFTGQNVRLSSPPLSKNLPEDWTKTILSRGSRGIIFN